MEKAVLQMLLPRDFVEHAVGPQAAGQLLPRLERLVLHLAVLVGDERAADSLHAMRTSKARHEVRVSVVHHCSHVHMHCT